MLETLKTIMRTVRSMVYAFWLEVDLNTTVAHNAHIPKLVGSQNQIFDKRVQLMTVGEFARTCQVIRSMTAGPLTPDSLETVMRSKNMGSD
jgi:hypothetical protein